MTQNVNWIDEALDANPDYLYLHHKSAGQKLLVHEMYEHVRRNLK